MVTGWQYRAVSVLSVISLTAGAVLVANQPLTQWVFTTYVPLFNRLEVTVLTGESLYWAIALTVLAVAGSLVPLYKPQPRRVLDTVFLAQKRVLVGGLALATLGYFKWSHRLPRATLVMTIGTLAVVIPAWFVWIRRRPPSEPGRTLVVGDDPAQIRQIAPSVPVSALGYLCPSIGTSAVRESSEPAADGGIIVGDDADLDSQRSASTLPHLGGLSRLRDLLVDYDVDTVVLAFRHADRAEFFGALNACHEQGVDAKVHREYANSVLVSTDEMNELVDVDLEPWDPLDHLFKRVFDVVFASVGLAALAPLMLGIATVIKLDSPGPVLYSQERTSGFGDTFVVYKFRTMVPEEGSAVPTEDHENDRITHAGQVLRKTHLDELPQLWSILVGQMSVVGPRAAWVNEEQLLEQDTPTWRKRWFVKPGLTGLAQINDAKSTDPSTKLQYDLEYIRQQTIWFDVKIVVRQLWNVFGDVYEVVRR
ncbi:sugar transferase [Natronobeatus ordinarius]|uniref:sugar transferase n=1 Tax=Natronobeatus ordinarius TaxID=2963433 RepID=UPI0020CF360B|nr:sugar transferase [Natronobeatus ordinarius]